MKIYLVRHGQDNTSVRGGWSDSPLTDIGIRQSLDLANELFLNAEKYNIGKIFSSDIVRAKQTAVIIADRLNLSIVLKPEFREVNNGVLAGLDNRIADEKYPNLFWRNLDWEEHYPSGESPKEFYERIRRAWEEFMLSFARQPLPDNKNALLVTHGGVINIIRCIASGKEYSNKEKYQGVPSARICFEFEV